MKSIAKSFTFAIMMVLVSFSVFAYDIPKDTLHVERFSIINNGTSSGKSLSQHTFIKRYYTPVDCEAAKAAYNSETILTIAGLNLPVLTIAKCEAINHSIYQ